MKIQHMVFYTATISYTGAIQHQKGVFQQYHRQRNSAAEVKTEVDTIYKFAIFSHQGPSYSGPTNIIGPIWGHSQISDIERLFLSSYPKDGTRFPQVIFAYPALGE